MKHIKLFEPLNEAKLDSFAEIKQAIDDKALAEYLKEIVALLKKNGVSVIKVNNKGNVPSSSIDIKYERKKLTLEFSNSGYSIYIKDENGSVTKSETVNALVHKLRDL